jgi:hypothetical protein
VEFLQTPLLQSLTLRGCNLSAKEFEILFEKLSLLETLDLGFSANLDQKCVDTITKLKWSLKSLKLNFCPKIELFQTLNCLSQMPYLSGKKKKRRKKTNH